MTRFLVLQLMKLQDFVFAVNKNARFLCGFYMQWCCSGLEAITFLLMTEMHLSIYLRDYNNTFESS